ncbi:MAG: hypothetical protein F2817_02675 [Actinobacteria bacterium]|nr:hypothetical protein [Actinomycetota bacterium]
MSGTPPEVAWSLMARRARAAIGEGLESVQLRVWLAQLSAAALDGDLLVLDAPSEAQEGIERELADILASAAKDLGLQVTGSWMLTEAALDAGEGSSPLEVAWAAIVRDARARIGGDEWDSWLAVLRPVSCDGDRFWVHAPEHARSWVESRLAPLLGAAASRTLGRPLTVQLVGAGEGRDLLGAHHLQGESSGRRRGLVPAQATMAPVPAALLCARGDADATAMGRRARYAQHPSKRPGELTPRDVTIAATLQTAALYNAIEELSGGRVAVSTTAVELWRALDPAGREERQPPYDARESLRGSLTRISAFYALCGLPVAVEVAVRPGRWELAHVAPAGFGAGGRRPTIRLVLEGEVLEQLRAWGRGRRVAGRDRPAWTGSPVEGYAILRLDHLRAIRSACELATYVICDALPAVDGRGRPLSRGELRQARRRGGARRTLRLSGRTVGELGDRLGVRHQRAGRRAARLMEVLLRLRALAPERFGRPAVRITDRGVFEFVLPLVDTARDTGEDRDAVQAVVARQLRQARRVLGELVAFPEHLQAAPHRGPPAA